RRICRDILSSETSRLGTKNNHEKVKQLVDELVTKKCKRSFSLKNYLLKQTTVPNQLL
ncbi:MAG: hypothetical protein HYW78_02730, partial [Parcubacteria group bacterium]|nr:hypothetical protein [Parcubacteria group bacterium]